MNLLYLTETDDMVEKLSEKGLPGVLLMIVIILALFSLAMLSQIIVHETGHLIFGLITGHKFMSFQILNLFIFKKNGKLCIKCKKRNGTTAQCLMMPKDMDHSSLCVFGGVLANTFSGIMALPVFFITDNYATRVFLLSFFVSGVITQVINTAPSHNFMNDGYIYRAILWDRQARKSHYCQILIAKALMDGLDYSQMPEEWFQIPENASLTEALTACHKLYCYYRLLAIGNYDQAKKCIDELYAASGFLPDEIKKDIYLENFYMFMISVGENPSVQEKILISLKYKNLKNIFQARDKNANILRIYLTYKKLMHNPDTDPQEEYNKAAPFSIFQGDMAFNRQLISNIE